VVDDSIVVIENIKRHLSEDADEPDAAAPPKLRAVLTAVREVAGAVTASTVTTVAVFAPIGFVGGQVGELFRPFAVTVAVALLGSLFVALTIVPVLAFWWLRRGRLRTHRHAHVDLPSTGRSPVTPLQRGYLPVLRRAIGHPVITIVIAVVVLGGTVALTPHLTTNFLGDSGQNTVAVSETMPAGTSLARTNAAATKVEKAIASVPGVQTVQTTVGSSGDATSAFLGNSGTNEATFSVTLSTDVDVVAAQKQMSDKLKALSGVGDTSVAGGQAAFGASTIDVTVQAADQATLRKATSLVRKAVAATPGTSDTTDNLSGDQPVVHVRVDRAKAAAAGATEAQIGQLVSALVSPTKVATLTSGGNTEDVVLSLRAAPSDLHALRNLSIATPTGPKKLSALASVERVLVPTTVSRQDGQRSATVSTTPAGKDLGTLTNDLRSRIDALALPSGATTEIGGVSQDQSQAFSQLFWAMLAAIAIVYVVMVATFKSLVQPLLLVESVPFASTGALARRLVTGTPLGVPALIGMLMLVGIVVTNAIVLIDLVNQRREAGMSVRDSVLDGARLRLRPILMTAVATIFALIPMSLGLTGGGAFISQPLAVVVIGGLVSSTLLTLVLVPVLYSLVERARGRLHRRGRDAGEDGGEAPTDAPADEPEPLAEVNA
jgi:HAE1 family hydrophobic/amphiphilic exporter-1